MIAIYVDPFSGVAGDMFLGALLDAGLSEAALRNALKALPITGYELLVGREDRLGLAATRASVRLDPAAHQPHRHLSDIHAILDAADLPGRAGAQAKDVFRRLAEAEAKVHGTTPEKIHFHEVGAVDAIVDIAGTCAALAILGVDQVIAGPPPLGSGTVEAAHGRLPVPAPATVELLRGVPTRASDEEGELTTPTGAALLVSLAERFGPMPAMTTEAVGYGAGSRQGRRLPNVLRVMVGRLAADDAEADAAWLIETNLDDSSGEALGAAAEAIFEAGALDVWMTPVLMKKGRPGIVLSCLAAPADLAAVEAAVFWHTGTFGVRRTLVERSKLAREHVTVETPYGAVRVKVGRRGGKIVSAKPEYEDCLRRARESGAALAAVFQAALAAHEAREHGHR